MIKHLASLSQERLIISFAPKTLAYSILKRIGELFPGPSKVVNSTECCHACLGCMPDDNLLFCLPDGPCFHLRRIHEGYILAEFDCVVCPAAPLQQYHVLLW